MLSMELLSFTALAAALAAVVEANISKPHTTWLHTLSTEVLGH